MEVRARTRVEVWSRRVYHRSRVDTAFTKKPFRSVEELDRFDCVERRYSVMGVIMRDVKGALVYSEEFASLVDTSWAPVALDTDRLPIMQRACALTEGISNRWWLVSQANGHLTFLDTISVRRLGNGIVELWARQQFARTQVEKEAAATVRFIYTLARVEIDCPKRLIRFVGIKKYNADGLVTSANEYARAAFATFGPIAPESLADAYSQRVCK